MSARVCDVEERNMKRAIAVVVLAFVAGFWVPSAFAREKGAAAKAKPVPSSSQVVLSQWNEIGKKLVAMAEDFPEDKYDFKPVQGVRSFAEILLHVSSVMYFFTNPVLGQKMPVEEDPKRENYKSKADIVAFVKKCVDDGAAAIKTKGDKGMAEWFTDPDSKQQMQFSDLAYGLIEHSGEHYGNLVVYYRLNNLIPPASRPRK
jgi:uncharacterized damage-inducible protein DinB